MAISNKDRISRTLDLLRDGLVPFVERGLKAKLGSTWQKSVNDSLREDLRRRADGGVAWDTQSLFTVMDKWWGAVFRFPLGRTARHWRRTHRPGSVRPACEAQGRLGAARDRGSCAGTKAPRR